MREKSRKEWIKNILIVFLVVLLLLTFFSNTIMNYSLPEVSVSYISNGSISTAIRGSGVIEGVDPYSVTIKEGRVIKSILVQKGDVVEKGDIIIELEESDSTEVQDAKKVYDNLVSQYQKTIVENKISSDIVALAEAGDANELNTKIGNLTTLMDTLESKKEALADIENKMSLIEFEEVDVSAEEAEIKKIKAEIEVLEEIEDIDAEVKSLQNSFNAMPEDEKLLNEYKVVNKLIELADKREKAVKKLQLSYKTVTACQNRITTLEKQIEKKQADQVKAGEDLKYDRVVAQNAVTEAEENYNKAYNEVNSQMLLQDLLKEIEDAKAAYKKLEEKSISRSVAAPVSGTIISIEVVAGETVEAGATLAVLQMSGKEYTMEMTVTKEQAAKIRIGDIATVANSWYYNDMVLTVAAIKNDVGNKGSGNKIIVFNVEGSDVIPGQSVTVSVGEKSANYDMVVPNNAIREDSNGTYILIVESKHTPLGNRYMAVRVDVTKLASDDVNTAISCGLEGYENVITTTTKPVAPGEQVRIAD